MPPFTPATAQHVCERRNVAAPIHCTAHGGGALRWRRAHIAGVSRGGAYHTHERTQLPESPADPRGSRVVGFRGSGLRSSHFPLTRKLSQSARALVRPVGAVRPGVSLPSLPVSRPLPSLTYLSRSRAPTRRHPPSPSKRTAPRRLDSVAPPMAAPSLLRLRRRLAAGASRPRRRATPQWRLCRRYSPRGWEIPARLWTWSSAPRPASSSI